MRKQLMLLPPSCLVTKPAGVIVITDTTYFGRQFGYLVVMISGSTKVIYYKRILSETAELYLQAKLAILRLGFEITAVVIDGRTGVKQVFGEYPVQICHFHQKQTIKKYLTSRPKLEMSKELWAVVHVLGIVSREFFSALLFTWYEYWEKVLKERTYQADGKKWNYTHKRVRSAYHSLEKNLPNLYTYEKNQGLCIPTTTNELDGRFSYLKELVRIHRGAKRELKYKIIEEVLAS